MELVKNGIYLYYSFLLKFSRNVKKSYYLNDCEIDQMNILFYSV